MSDAASTDPQSRAQDFYQRLRREVRAGLSDAGWMGDAAEWLLVAPDLFHLVLRLTLDPSVPAREKMRLGLVVAYFVNPFDIVPEGLLGPGGYLEDLLVAAAALDGYLNRGGAPAASRLWAGEGDLLEILQRLLGRIPEWLGRNPLNALIDRMRRRVGGRRLGDRVP